MRLRFGWMMACAVAFSSGTALAQSVPSARSAYDAAVEAHERGDYAGAAREFAHADRLVPNDGALRDAIVEATRADDAAIGAMLIARARRSPGNVELQQVAGKAKDKFRGRAGRFDARCPRPCAVEVDGQPADPERDGWLPVGAHVIVLALDGQRDEHRVEIFPLETTAVHFVPAKPTSIAVALDRPPPLPSPPPSRGLSPVWFWFGAGATLVAGAATVVSGLDVNGRRSDFDGLRCSAVGSAACDEQASSGSSAVVRTNVLLGITAVVGIATLVSAFLVDWRSPKPAALARF